jgi:hypothetical protein
MRFIEYILVTVLGSSGVAAAEPPSAGARTITADAVTQPAGGGAEGILGQATGGSPGKQAGTGRKGRVHSRRGHRTARRQVASNVSSSNAGAVKPSANRAPPPPRHRAAPSNTNKNSK